ncbi:MAG: tryptophan synthase subunit alpha [Neisseria sp.]|nr:tryptophan synthase subunit alpha [Neisseria sp.]
MNRIASVFQSSADSKALITYITTGDPTLELTLDIMHTLAANGADIIELGVPFSDPMADGPTIQRAAQRAVDNGVSLDDVLTLVARFRTQNTTTPVVLMGYLNPIHRMGYARFAAAAAQAGVDGVLTVDCPAESIDDLQGCLKAQGIATIFLVAPTTSPERIATIAAKAEGFIYYVSLKGVTGSALLDTDAVARKIAVLRQHTALPIAVGFGIKNGEDARRIAAFADAAVIGSRLVETIEQHPQQPCAAVATVTAELKNALRLQS